jgi:hypothetical protein
MERLAVIARLKTGTFEQAKELISRGPPFDPGELGFESHGVYALGEEVVFLFEGPDADERVRALLNDPARAASFSVWGPFLDGVPRVAHEVYYWRKTGR